MIVPIVPVVSKKMFRRPEWSYGNATQTIANDPDDWDDLDYLDRIEFYPDDRDDHVNFESPGSFAIVWVAFPYDRPGRLNIFFETTGTIRTIIWKPGFRICPLCSMTTTVCTWAKKITRKYKSSRWEDLPPPKKKTNKQRNNKKNTRLIEKAKKRPYYTIALSRLFQQSDHKSEFKWIFLCTLLTLFYIRSA